MAKCGCPDTWSDSCTMECWLEFKDEGDPSAPFQVKHGVKGRLCLAPYPLQPNVLGHALGCLPEQLCGRWRQLSYGCKKKLFDFRRLGAKNKIHDSVAASLNISNQLLVLWYKHHIWHICWTNMGTKVDIGPLQHRTLVGVAVIFQNGCQRLAKTFYIIEVTCNNGHNWDPINPETEK